MNHHLAVRNLSVNDLIADLADGLKLIALLEILSGQKIPHVKNPKFLAQKVSNIAEALNFMEKRYNITFVGVTAKGTRE